MTLWIVDVPLPVTIADARDRSVEGDELMSPEQAIDELLSTGISLYDTADESTTELHEDVFTNVQGDQQDPALDN